MDAHFIVRIEYFKLKKALTILMSLLDIGEIVASEVIVRRVPRFAINYADLQTLRIEEKLIILKGPFNGDFKGRKDAILLPHFIFHPHGPKEKYSLPAGYAISVVDKENDHLTYEATFITFLRNGTKIVDVGDIPKNLTKLYTDGWYECISRHGRHYIVADPKLVVSGSNISFQDRLSLVYMSFYYDLNHKSKYLNPAPRVCYRGLQIHHNLN
ncbi:hypothetical protein PPL_05755 [Heterostelium album PN500]|uniref:Uncharacterized protein n=1 Tax=Heterostelium pallidum (strain ATCC 26659 / Pp 5 / PN500) TaxID=670386 RepID=D3BB23_HETP5|nr:hypothetical protein PPL_05755 [Heterostelium album PN500]EFA81760.1 hypothetical protein PPL_05755 [Heterostelium album PN500]|eukprot:XP_020433877.1 hypothetical protein PPL_05755 [Heterostelium album PN500]